VENDISKFEVKSVRLSNDDINFLKENKISLTDLTRDKVKEVRKITRKERKVTKNENLFSGLICLCLGIFFLFYIESPNFISWMVVFGIGFALCIFGLYSIFAGMGFNPISYFFKEVFKNRRRNT